jgi:hypothetical protein
MGGGLRKPRSSSILSHQKRNRLFPKGKNGFFVGLQRFISIAHHQKEEREKVAGA